MPQSGTHPASACWACAYRATPVAISAGLLWLEHYRCDRAFQRPPLLQMGRELNLRQFTDLAREPREGRPPLSASSTGANKQLQAFDKLSSPCWYQAWASTKQEVRTCPNFSALCLRGWDSITHAAVKSLRCLPTLARRCYRRYLAAWLNLRRVATIAVVDLHRVPRSVARGLFALSPYSSPMNFSGTSPTCPHLSPPVNLALITVCMHGRHPLVGTTEFVQFIPLFVCSSIWFVSGRLSSPSPGLCFAFLFSLPARGHGQSAGLRR